MTKLITLSLGALAMMASSASAQVVVRAPFVRVETNGPGTYVRAPFVNLFVPAGPPVYYGPPPGAFVPGPPPMVQINPGPTALPQPRVVPQPLPNGPAEPRPAAPKTDIPAPPGPGLPAPPAPVQAPKAPTLNEFLKSFKPKAGNYEVTLTSPVTGQPETVRFSLPGDPQTVRSSRNSIEFVYGPRRFVRIEFDRDGPMVISR
jgi:hypothetical protein